PSTLAPTSTRPAAALDEPLPVGPASSAPLPAPADSSAASLPGAEPTGTPAEPASEPPADQPPSLAPSDQPTLPTVGQTASNADWEVTRMTYGPYDELADQPTAGRPDSRQVLVEFAARNRQDRTATFTLSDFAVETAGGRRYSPAAQT